MYRLWFETKKYYQKYYCLLTNIKFMEIKTIGEMRVRIDFNVTNNDNVTKIKQGTAELINLVEELKLKDPRLASLAQTSYEEAAMWAVKLATT